jgi:hypothetical protein
MEWDPAPSTAEISHNRRAMGDKNPRMTPLRRPHSLEGVMTCMAMGRKSPRHAYLQTSRVSPWAMAGSLAGQGKTEASRGGRTVADPSWDAPQKRSSDAS